MESKINFSYQDKVYFEALLINFIIGADSKYESDDIMAKNLRSIARVKKS